MAQTLIPLRIMVATAPSGGEIRLVKYSESDRELSYYHGLLTAIEDGVFWKAKLAAERPWSASWDKARAILEAANWTVRDDA